MNANYALVTIGVVFVGLFFIYALLGIRIIRPWEKALVERLGKYSRTLESGLHFIVPFFERIWRVDLREQVADVPPQAVITKDNVVVEVDAVVYLEVVDPFNYKYNIENFWLAVIKLAQTNLRNVVGDMTLDESLVSRDTINQKLRTVLDGATDKWGTRVTRVEIQRIEPPMDVQEAMHRQMKAERDRRATILEAEGQKMAAMLVAEGQKEARIRQAEGEAQALIKVADAQRYEKLTVAEGEALAIEKVYGSIHRGNPTKELITVQYLKSLEGIANGQATKIFLPYEAINLLSGLGSMGQVLDRSSERS